jgi:hypothetical protein
MLSEPEFESESEAEAEAVWDEDDEDDEEEEEKGDAADSYYNSDYNTNEWDDNDKTGKIATDYITYY